MLQSSDDDDDDDNDDDDDDDDDDANASPAQHAWTDAHPSSLLLVVLLLLLLLLLLLIAPPTQTQRACCFVGRGLRAASPTFRELEVLWRRDDDGDSSGGVRASASPTAVQHTHANSSLNNGRWALDPVEGREVKVGLVRPVVVGPCVRASVRALLVFRLLDGPARSHRSLCPLCPVLLLGAVIITPSSASSFRAA